MVYVLSKNGQPVMPTKNHSKVRLLLKSGKAKVVNRCPFTIQLTGVCKTFTKNRKKAPVFRHGDELRGKVIFCIF